MAEITSKQELLQKLQAYAFTPDDDSIRYKEQIKEALLDSPELLYALHEKGLETELFNEDESINREGEWDRYFGGSANIRPYLFIPDTQDTTKHFLCYQVDFDELPRNNSIQKYTQIVFTILIHGSDSIDTQTGIPRHDLIASIIRERFNWSSIFGMQMKLISSKESTTDNNWIVKTLTFQITDLNSIVNTPYGEDTQIINNEYWR